MCKIRTVRAWTKRFLQLLLFIPGLKHSVLSRIERFWIICRFWKAQSVWQWEIASHTFTRTLGLVIFKNLKEKAICSSDTKLALDHWSIKGTDRPLPPGPNWFTFMQILRFQIGFSRFHALAIGPQLLKWPVPAGCNSSNSLPPCFWVARS